MGNATDPITISALVLAPLTRVWECWTGPEHIVHWNAASPEWHCPEARNDLRVGGAFSYRMEARDGSFGFDMAGAYDEVLPGARIAYTLEDGRPCTVHFATEGEGTRVTEVFAPEHQNSVDMQRQGWQAILDNFKAYCEKGIAEHRP